MIKMSRKKNLCKITLSTAILYHSLGGVPVSAAENLETFNLDQLLVTATSYSSRDLDTAAATEIIDEQKIQNMGAQNAFEILQNVTGVNLTASPTGNRYLGFRGLKSSVVVMIDGIPLMQDGNYDLDSIAASGISRIEIVKGGSSVLYGTNASTAVINIIMKKNIANNKISVGAGDSARRKAATNLQLGKTTVTYDHYQNKNIGSIYTGGTGNTAYHYDQSRFERNSLNLRIRPDEHFDIQYLYSKKESDCIKIADLTSKYQSDFNSEISYNFGQVSYLNKDLKATLHARNRTWEFGPIGKARSTKLVGDNYGINLQNKWAMKNFDLTLGTSYEHEQAKSGVTNAIKKERDSSAIFFLAEKDLSPSTRLSFGGRQAYVQDAGNEFCPQLQVLHKLSSTSSLYTNINKNYRVPLISEYYGYTGSTVANPNLKPEKGWTYELGWKNQLNETSLLKLNIFYMTLEDRIVSDTIGGIKAFYNLDEYKNSGLELSYEEKLSNKFNYGLSATFQNPKTKDHKNNIWENYDGRVALGANLGYQINKTKVNTFINYQYKRAFADPLLDINLNIKQTLSKNDSLLFKVNNLLNRKDVNSSSGVSGSVLEDRNFLLTYEHNF